MSTRECSNCIRENVSAYAISKEKIKGRKVDILYLYHQIGDMIKF